MNGFAMTTTQSDSSLDEIRVKLEPEDAVDRDQYSYSEDIRDKKIDNETTDIQSQSCHSSRLINRRKTSKCSVIITINTSDSKKGCDTSGDRTVRRSTRTISRPKSNESIAKQTPCRADVATEDISDFQSDIITSEDLKRLVKVEVDDEVDASLPHPASNSLSVSSRENSKILLML